MRYILSFDAGTTSVRALLFDAEGAVRSVAQREIRQSFPQPGWVEHDPQEIWSAQIAVAIEAMAWARVGPPEIAGLGVTNQRETTVIWDRRTGEPIHPAIVWQDRRTAPRCDQLRAQGREPFIRRRTGLCLDAYFSATKIEWILDHIPGARRRAEAGKLAFGTIDTWLVWKLTEGRRHVTDPGNASRTLLYNITTGSWDDALLKLFRVPAALLPEVRTSSEVYGEVTSELGLRGVPIAGIAGDQQAALFGQMCVRPGLAKNTYGTGCFLLNHLGTTPQISRHRLLTTVAWQIGRKREYAIEGSVFVAGAVVQWLRDGLKLAPSAEEISALAATVPDSGGVCLVPAFTGLGAPHWDAYARGAVVGLTRDSSAAHLARAALDGIAFQVADLVEAMEADTGRRLRELRVDGGASRSEPLMQFQADLLRRPVIRPQVTETTALGAAYLAGLAVAFWKNVGELSTQWKIEKVFEPRMKAARAAELQARWHEAVRRARGWEMAVRPGARRRTVR